jgi:hypothetical protein
MINLFQLSIEIPSFPQLLGMILTLSNCFLIFLYLEKTKEIQKFWNYLGLFFCIEIVFCFLWRFFYGDKIQTFQQLWLNIKDIENSNDIIVFNCLFAGLIFQKLKSMSKN